MAFLDNAGLTHFTAWVKERLSGKQDVLEPDASMRLEGGNIGVALPTRTVTKAEYDVLTEEEKQANVLYLVEGMDNSGLSGAVPIGAVIPFMALSAPEGYLICDGAVYGISGYPALAAFFEAQFGAKNHFGGDGTSTFAVPDMRNLFLRGWHGEAEESLSGEIGARQEATVLPHVRAIPDGSASYLSAFSQADVQSPDSTGSQGAQALTSSQTWNSKFSSYGSYTVRPVNMAVLYCIKASEVRT